MQSETSPRSDCWWWIRDERRAARGHRPRERAHLTRSAVRVAPAVDVLRRAVDHEPHDSRYDGGLGEILRVLKPGGECGILDFGEPRGLLGRVYRVYFRRVLPAVGTFVSGVRGPYAYLPASVERFPHPDEMLVRMRRAGFREASWTPYTFGIAGLYRAKK